jgi:zinc protease
MSLFSEVITGPAFDPNELEKLRTRVLTALSVKEQDPQYVAEREFAKRLYGGHPYGRMPEGTGESISGIKANQIKNWWRQNARPAQAVLIFAGDIEPPAAFELAQKYLGNWQGETEPEPVAPLAIPAIEQRRIYLVNRPGSAQVQICLGQRSITRNQQPDYFISRVVTDYFGGSFNSRLNETLRIQQGLTYGAWGYYKAQRFDGTFQVQTFTKNQSAAQAVQAILDLIDQLRKCPPDEQEMDSSKRYITGSFILNRQTPGQLAEDLWLTELENLGTDYFDRLLAEVAKTTAQDCLELVKKTIDPQKMVIVVVGDAGKIRGDLEQIAPVTVIPDRIP